MDLRRQLVVWRDALVSARVAVHVRNRAERRVKLASLALRRARRRSERMLDAGLLHAQTQVRCVVAAVRVQAKTWRQRSSRVAARWGAAAAASARNALAARAARLLRCAKRRWRAGVAVDPAQGVNARRQLSHRGRDAALAPLGLAGVGLAGAAGRAARIRRPRPAQRPDLRAHHAGAGAVLEPAGRLCRAWSRWASRPSSASAAICCSR